MSEELESKYNKHIIGRHLVLGWRGYKEILRIDRVIKNGTGHRWQMKQMEFTSMSGPEQGKQEQGWFLTWPSENNKLQYKTYTLEEALQKM